jgi:hypothetical protein|tara:strand:+ start:127 stop:369 length:243 start_codon:yes stop_codon:yes gene_type:complete
MPNNDLINILNTTLVEQSAQQVDQPTDNPTTALNYQFMYKQLESAVEEILVKYPNDDIVKELKQNLIRNLRPILEQLNNG